MERDKRSKGDMTRREKREKERERRDREEGRERSKPNSTRM